MAYIQLNHLFCFYMLVYNYRKNNTSSAVMFHIKHQLSSSFLHLPSCF